MMLGANRARIEALVEMLIAILDQDDGDTDIEQDADIEADPAEIGIADLDGLILYHRDVDRYARLSSSRQMVHPITHTVD